jgi:hypothetical protein
MKRSLNAILMSFVIGLLLMPAAIYAQSDQDAAKASPIEHPHVCKSGPQDRHSFIVRLKDEAALILCRMKSAITGKGGSFEGDKECGSFEGKSALGTIKGEYRSISDKEIEITIDDKPFIVSYSRIELEIKKYLS